MINKYVKRNKIIIRIIFASSLFFSHLPLRASVASQWRRLVALDRFFGPPWCSSAPHCLSFILPMLEYKTQSVQRNTIDIFSKKLASVQHRRENVVSVFPQGDGALLHLLYLQSSTVNFWFRWIQSEIDVLRLSYLTAFSAHHRVALHGTSFAADSLRHARD